MIEDFKRPTRVLVGFYTALAISTSITKESRKDLKRLIIGKSIFLRKQVAINWFTELVL